MPKNKSKNCVSYVRLVSLMLSCRLPSSTDGYFQNLTQAHRRRQKSWHKMRAGFAETVKTNFHRHCARRNFTGEIDFLHEDKKLKMKVGNYSAIYIFPREC